MEEEIKEENIKKRKYLTIPNVLTYCSLLFALIGMFFVSVKSLFVAIIFLALCDIFDASDGYIARRFNMSTPFGITLEPIVDTVAFVLPPFVISLFFFQNKYFIPLAIFYVCCGVFRLARFDSETIPGYFKGLPTSISAHLIYFSLLLHIPLNYLPFLYPIIGILMVSSFKLKKRHSLYLTILMVTLNVSFAIANIVI